MKCQCKGHKCYNLRGCELRKYERLKKFFLDYFVIMDTIIDYQKKMDAQNPM